MFRQRRALIVVGRSTRVASMQTSVLREINRLRQMTVAELRQEWERLYGEPTHSRNRDQLWKRLAWRVQELAHGGLSDRAKARLEEWAPALPTNPKSVAAPKPSPTKVRDLRLPTCGTVLTRQYHGREIRVLTLEDGFEWEGRRYGSLSAVAWAVTGQKWNGLLFFGLTQRKR